MRIADILRSKGATVATVTETTTVTGLLAELVIHNIGAMVVVGPRRRCGGHRLGARRRTQTARPRP